MRGCMAHREAVAAIGQPGLDRPPAKFLCSNVCVIAADTPPINGLGSTPQCHKVSWQSSVVTIFRDQILLPPQPASVAGRC